MTPTITAFKHSPDGGKGLARDMRLRWALEEVGQPYEVRLVSFDEMKQAAHRALHPFGQIPTYQEGDLVLFESGAIVLHIAAKSEALAPADEAGRARTTAWVIAALNSIEPYAQMLIHLKESRAQAESLLNRRLEPLSAWLDGKDYLESRFTAGDLMMTAVLRELVDSGTLARFPVLDAYRKRCEARPAFGRALEAQMQVFRDNAPANP